ncbi:hypothetical protein MPTK1_3g23760 [Marchantia polymorpha subsp. ruderalis]|uniref:Uncharacterized protein n=1 Tax=Marchantia polymorpha subsp. ruderalis TaxID=1480154 RepID=A0AAF6B432_MARPO|nr:hypothetical protein Mp_3g23760 [Marchantia polymorpha subsp. ruderalis]
MALVSRPVEVPVPCPSPARVGSTGTMHYLLQKERPMDPHSYVNRGPSGANAAKSSKEFVHVCREVVSVSCGQPLLSYKPKLTKSAKIVKPSDAKAAAGSSSRNAVESGMRSVSSRVVANAIRLAGASEVVPAVEFRRGDSLPKAASAASRSKGPELQPARRSLSQQGDGLESEGAEKKASCQVPSSDRHQEDGALKGDYPVFQMSTSSLGPKPLPDDYHKALIPFLRAEWDASAKILKRRQCNQVSKKGVHRRSTSLGSTSTSSAPATDQKAWQSYTRDSYPPFSASKKHSFFRLAPGENL